MQYVYMYIYIYKEPQQSGCAAGGGMKQIRGLQEALASL